MPPKNCKESKLKNPISPADRSESKKGNPGEVEDSRERLKRHRMEVAGRVWIPELWGQEEFLEEWIDCTVFDATLRNKGIMSARASLMDQPTRPNC